MKIKIRETREEDFDQIVKLLANRGVWADFKKEKFPKMLQRNKGFYLVAEVDGKIVGNIFGSHDGGVYGYLYKLAVDRGFQRRKIATGLVNVLFKRFKKLNIDWVFGHVYKNNKEALKFFKTLKFKSRKDILAIDNWEEETESYRI